MGCGCGGANRPAPPPAKAAKVNNGPSNQAGSYYWTGPTKRTPKQPPSR